MFSVLTYDAKSVQLGNLRVGGHGGGHSAGDDVFILAKIGESRKWETPVSYLLYEDEMGKSRDHPEK
jgi:hypothetical protein